MNAHVSEQPKITLILTNAVFEVRAVYLLAAGPRLFGAGLLRLMDPTSAAAQGGLLL